MSNETIGYKRPKNILVPDEVASRLHAFLELYFYAGGKIDELEPYSRSAVDSFMSFMDERQAKERERLIFAHDKQRTSRKKN